MRLGPLQAAHPHGYRRHRPEGRSGALVAHARPLVSAGVPIMQALEITGRTAGNGVIEDAMGRVSERQGGPAIAEPLERAGVSGHGRADARRGRGDRLARPDAQKIADFYEDEVDAAVKSLTSILEPLMLGVGGIVGSGRHLDVPAALQHDEHRQV